VCSQLSERASTIELYNSHYALSKENKKKATQPTITKDCAERRRKDILQLLTLHSDMIRGTVRYLSALYRIGIFSTPKFPYGSEEFVFEKRFEPFYTVYIPSPLQYEQFKSTTDFTKFKAQSLLDSSDTAYDEAREILLPRSRVEEDESSKGDVPLIPPSFAKDLLRVVIMQKINLQKLKTVASTEIQTDLYKVIFDFSHDAVYPVIPVEQVKRE